MTIIDAETARRVSEAIKREERDKVEGVQLCGKHLRRFLKEAERGMQKLITVTSIVPEMWNKFGIEFPKTAPCTYGREKNGYVCMEGARWVVKEGKK